jgi:predicted nucleotidyltransferase
MRTAAPRLLPLFRSEMQVRLLALLLLQPERAWTLEELTRTLDTPKSSIHRELERAEAAGIIRRDATVRPHHFRAAPEEPLNEPLTALLQRSVGVEEQLREALARPDVVVALVHGSWAGGTRRPDSDIDVLVVGDADLRALRRVVRPIGASAGRTIDLTVVTEKEFRTLLDDRASFARSVLKGPTIALVGDLDTVRST